MSLETREGFVADHKEFGLHIRSEIARKPALQVAAKIAALANKTADAQDEETKTAKQGSGSRKHLRGSYTAKPDGNLRVGRNTRAIAIVESRVLQARVREQGTSTQKPSRPLLRAAIAVSIADFGHFDGTEQ